LPKLRGFKSQRRLPENVYTGQLEQIKKTIITTETLHEANLISSPYVKVKLLVNGELTSKKDIRLQSASQKAIEATEKAGGSFQQVAQLGRPAKKSENSKK
jgi:ribosomal protein L15